MTGTDWRADAACLTHDAAMFDGPTATERNPRPRLERAIAVCQTCPAFSFSQCILDAFRNEGDGIRGGALWNMGKRVELPAYQPVAPAVDPIRRDPHQLVPCGRESAYKRHWRRGEPIDDACRAAHAMHTRRYSARKAS